MTTTQPETIAATRSRLRAPVALGVATLAATAVVAVRDPNVAQSYGLCPMYALTGLWCPACGGLRATHDLVHGDLAGAWAMNPVWVLAVPLLVALWVMWVVRAAGRRPMPSGRAWMPWTVLVVVFAFTVLRNIPALTPWLAP
jgi:hypothetical protein